ncbi:MAG: hypothetical protein ACLVL7_14270 [Anaerotruncus massiliensis (ex Togo et al. 2019)]
MYAQSKEYLLEKIRACGLKSNPYTTEKALEKSQESHIGAVLFESETLAETAPKHALETKSERSTKGGRFSTASSRLP